MTGFALLKTLHMICGFLSVGGFALRGYWLATGNPLLQQRTVKTLPHVIDTLLLGSAVGMLLIWQASPFQFSWLTAKVLALLLYIVLGIIAMRFGKTATQRLSAWCAAMLTASYILSVAFTKSPWGLLALF